MTPQPKLTASRAANASTPAKAAKASKPLVRKPPVKQIHLADGKKICTICEIAKPFCKFAKQPHGAGGVTAWCSDCTSAKYKAARAALGPPKHKVRSASERKADAEAADKICTTCLERKDFEKFHVRMKSFDGRSPVCIQCASESQRQYRRTMKGFIKNMLNGSRNSAQQRELPGEHTLTYDDLIKKLEVQKQRCFIFGVPLAFSPFTHWQASPERTENDKTYTYANVVVVSLEANTQAQWTRKKATEAMTHVDQPLSEEELTEFKVELATTAKRTTHRKQEHEGCYFCFDCEEFKGKDKFEKTARTRCIICTNRSIHEKRKASWRFRFHMLMAGSKTSAAKRKGEASTHTITFDDMVDMFAEQHGLCAYSGTRVQKAGDWQASIERLDSTKGYTRDNCCIICVEFNSIDKTVEQKDSKVKCGGWSREKYLYVRSQFTTTYYDEVSLASVTTK